MAKNSRIGKEIEERATIRLAEMQMDAYSDALPLPKGQLCGRNSCITPLEDRDGVLFCINCGPMPTTEQEK